MDFSSAEFYEGRLVASPSVSAHLLKDLPGVASNELTSKPVNFIDTAGASYDETIEPNGDSRFNTMEAELVLQNVQELLDAGLAPANMAVISPYSAQVRLLREKLRQPEIEIDSVDGFQGREKEAVIVSLVRSNPKGEIGFLEDIRRTNVALTRARRKLIIIGDSATITAHPFYQRLVAYFDSIGAYHSVWER
jgi:ATP-dependent RNA/DNA helicase IGHMBP2